MDMNPTHMQLLLQYMYRGEVNVQQAQLGPLMQSAKALQIKGLCSTNPEDKFTDFSTAHQNLFNNTQGEHHIHQLLLLLIHKSALQGMNAKIIIVRTTNYNFNTKTCFLWVFLASHTINVPTVPAPPTALPAGIVSAPPPTIFDQQQHPPATADILASVGGTPQAKANKKRKSDWSEGTAGNP